MSLRCAKCNCVIEDVEGSPPAFAECDCDSGLCDDCCACDEEHHERARAIVEAARERADVASEPRPAQP